MGSLKPGLERRRHSRLAIALPMEYRRIYDPCLRTGLVINLSNEGFLFCCRRDLSVGSILAVTVMFVDGFELTSLDANAKIIWKELACESDWNEYRYGAEFLFISKSNQEKLAQLLRTEDLRGPEKGSVPGYINARTV
jgi:hypothetical protein